jgi:hypothetical protein
MVYPLPGKSRWASTVGTLVAVALALAQSRVNARLQSNLDAGPTPLSATRCPYTVASGDLNAGIQLVGDHSCAAGGIGCFENVCRYCKFTETPQSTAFLPCKNLGYDFGGSVAASAPANPVVTVTSPAPIVVQPPSQPSSAPAPRPAPASNPATDCPYSVSAGDLAVGVLLVGDATCASGGLGCYKGICRYCKIKETPQSSHWVNCSSLGYPKTTAPPVMNPLSIDDTETNCPYPVPEADFADGIQLVGDATCAKGGRGCFQNVCRFCKFRNTAKSKHMVPCGDLGYPQFGTPVTDPASIGVGGCPYDVSDGDAAVGINLVGDSSCANGGLGCFENVCRYCKVKDTPQSKHLLKCADVVASPLWKPTDVVGPPPAPVTPPSVIAPPRSTSGTPTKHPSGVGGPSGDSLPPTSYSGSASSSVSGSDGIPPVGAYGNGNPPHDPFVGDSTTPPLMAGAGPTSCEGLAADLPSGITIVPDSSCSTSSPGCVRVATSACRYCMKVPTPIGQGLPLCDQLAPPVTDMPPQTQPVVDLPAPAVVIGATPSICEQIAANSDFPPGISAVADPSCMTDDDIDCIHIANSACRICKKVTTSFTQGLTRCDKIKSPAVATKPLETPPIGDQFIVPGAI